MSKFFLEKIKKLNEKKKKYFFEKINTDLSKLSIYDRITFIKDNIYGNIILTSSFGIQSIVIIHLIVNIINNIEIVFIDTGYLFPETYNFVDILIKKFNLNIKVYRSIESPSWQESRYGELWKKGINGINLYNKINKVNPMKKALLDLNVKVWISGLRKCQSDSRKNLNFLYINRGVFKFLPIYDWNNNKIFSYIKKNNLLFHPLYYKGYRSIGDIHTTSIRRKNMREEDTRFFGLKRECGIHENI